MVRLRSYVPVLRWKRAEWGALGNLGHQARNGLTPLIEVTSRGLEFDNPEAPTNLEIKLPKIAERVLENWGPDPILFDLNLIHPLVRTTLGQHAIDVLFSAGRAKELTLIPVTSPDRTWPYQEAVKQVAEKDKNGLCLRLRFDSLSQTTFVKDLEDLLDALDSIPGVVDLIVDLGHLGPASPSLFSLSSRVPRLNEWRSFTVVAGSFPKDLVGIPVGAHLIDRVEWQRWQSEIEVFGKRCLRFPSFGDYTIQHANFSEPIPGMNVSASIRYTSATQWLLMRGEGLKNKKSSGYAQYAANAQLLIDRNEFLGPDFSDGDMYIWRAASHKNDGPGNPEAWLRAGINHHMTFGVRQIQQAVNLGGATA